MSAKELKDAKNTISKVSKQEGRGSYKNLSSEEVDITIKLIEKHVLECPSND